MNRNACGYTWPEDERATLAGHVCVRTRDHDGDHACPCGADCPAERTEVPA